MRFKNLGISVLVVLGILALGLAILAANLPFAAQRLIEYRFHPVLSAQNLRFTLAHVGVSRTLVSDLGWGQDISADLVDIVYDLRGRHLPAIRQLTLSGLTVKAQVDPDQGIVIDGVLPGKDFRPSPGGAGAALDRFPASGGREFKRMLTPYLPFLPEQIQISNSRLMLAVDGKMIQIPFDATLSVDKSHQKAVCHATLYPFGQPVSLTARVDAAAGVETFRLAARAFDVHPLADFLPPVAGKGLSGTIDLTVEKLFHNTWQVSISGLGVAGPEGPKIPHASARILRDENRITLLGQLGLAHPAFGDLAVFSRTLVVLDPSGSGIQEIDMVCETQPRDTLALIRDNTRVDLNRPLAALSLQIRDRAVSGNLVVTFLETVIQLDTGQVSVGQGAVNSEIQGNLDTGAITVDLHSQLSGIQLENPDSTAQFRRMETTGRIFLDVSDPLMVQPRVDLTTELSAGSVTVPGKNLYVQGIFARLPVTFPDAGGTGRFSMEKLMIDNRTYLKGDGRIQRTGQATVEFDGKLQVPENQDLTIGFNGFAGLTPRPYLRAEAATNRFRFSPQRFEKLLPRTTFLAEYDLEASAAGHVSFENHQITTGADLIIHDGTLSLPDLDLTASGIRGRVSLKDLLSPASLPGQVLTVDHIRAGDFTATDAGIRFTIEAGPSLLVENVRVNWAGGLVSTESIRIPSPDQSIAVTLYCDRIQLTGLLEQMGGFDVQGKGSLNGRIPVVFKDGNLSFDNAFLFSTPGQGGRIVIHNPQKLVAGIPVGSPRYVQLDLAQEALRDFEYAWAKLIFNTQGDTLTVNMELDGKPGRLLPFVYKSEANTFVRVDANSPGSRFQGIKLDVNLSLPFNQMVTLGNKLQKLLK